LPVKYKFFDELENGFDFYAPQTLFSPESKNIIIAWMYTFGERIITDANNLDHGWSHCMTLPREISIKDGKLYQNPVKSLEKYRKNEIIYDNFDRDFFTLENNKCSEIIISADISVADKFTIVLPAGILEFNKKGGFITFDRTNFGYDMRSDRQKENDEPEIRKINFDFKDILDLQIFVDVSAVEIFINGGEKVISSRFYPENKDYNIEFRLDGKTTIKEIKKYDIVI
jgi:beta-fructofuranosidase